MINLDLSVYPFRGLAPAQVEDEMHYLHAAIQWHNGVKQQLGMVTTNELVEPRISVNRYVRPHTSRTGSQHQDTIAIRPPARLDSRDLGLLIDTTSNFGLVWGYGEHHRTGGLITVPETMVTCTFGELEFTMTSTDFMLGCIRALAAPGLERHFASQS